MSKVNCSLKTNISKEVATFFELSSIRMDRQWVGDQEDRWAIDPSVGRSSRHIPKSTVETQGYKKWAAVSKIPSTSDLSSEMQRSCSVS